ncbi:conserved protein of unknown function (plasmid) [Rhodovastum atsumiense]|uniref:Uncharacterized protein n=1 Tax=Rhodovastum atsumiense TaxID=504468 RepID=A0A5M6IU57_9PROT|nr:hypothetical protein [Rhodovastum atsumiense]KAA5611802.1 hypothetical protein F1189_12235 [Rhodovastum atsumiense]CAH2606090.1 conserved protein of unknown function [Rhodovastum atsumiense]
MTPDAILGQRLGALIALYAYGLETAGLGLRVRSLVGETLQSPARGLPAIAAAWQRSGAPRLEQRNPTVLARVEREIGEIAGEIPAGVSIPAYASDETAAALVITHAAAHAVARKGGSVTAWLRGREPGGEQAV